MPRALAQTNSAPQTVLRLERRGIDVNGKAASVYRISQPDGSWGLTTQKGAVFRVRVENRISEPSLIHWHGLTPPWQQDGVPGISGPPIAAGGTADYDFPLRFGGTFWMHSHQGLQEQLLMAAPLIIKRSARPARPAGHRGDAGRFQLYAAGRNLCCSQEGRQHAGHGQRQIRRFDRHGRIERHGA